MKRIWTMNPQHAVDHSDREAPADVVPTFAKKRISSAMRAAELGTARATNWIAYWSMTTRPNRTGLMHAPIVANACATPPSARAPARARARSGRRPGTLR